MFTSRADGHTHLWYHILYCSIENVLGMDAIAQQPLLRFARGRIHFVAKRLGSQYPKSFSAIRWLVGTVLINAHLGSHSQYIFSGAEWYVIH